MTAGVELTGLVKSFGKVRAVRDVSIAVAPGETVALLGPNGAGKSTTIDMLLGLAEPDAGTVSIFGVSPERAVDAGAIGAMLQTGQLLRDLSARELVTMMASLYPAPLPVAEVLALTGIEAIADRRTQKLSGGETQRVRFAIALVSNPQLLVLDEPTVAMDVESRHGFWTAMRAFAARGKTVIFATHYLEEADSYADRAVLMARGRVVADGPTTEIKAMVGTRTIRATLPAVELAALAALPGVTHAERRGEAVELVCEDSDAAIRALLEAYPAVRDIEIGGAGLEQAFLQLTGDPDDDEEDGGVNGAVYMRFELLRTLRNRRFFVFSLGFPLVLFYVIAGPQRHDNDFGGTGIPAPVYYMIGLAAFGTMNAMLATGARITTERAAGWNRQLRLTPLTTRVYFRTKVATGYLTALVTLLLLYAAGISLGVRLSAGTWLHMTLLMLVGLIPFAALGILFGHLLTPDSIGPVMGGSTALFALLGGTWFPVQHGAMHTIASALPSYWLVQAAHVALGGGGWSRTGWLVVGAWTLGCAILAGRAYRRDTRRA